MFVVVVKLCAHIVPKLPKVLLMGSRALNCLKSRILFAKKKSWKFIISHHKSTRLELKEVEQLFPEENANKLANVTFQKKSV